MGWPKGVPRKPRIPTRAAELTEASAPVVLGTLPEKTLNPSPHPSMMTAEDGTRFQIEDGPPPWELHPTRRQDATDARRFVEVPTHWELRWINPKHLDVVGWRWWQPVMASDPSVKVKVRQMIDPGNNIRRGGPGGDLLAFMPRSWVEKRLIEKKRRADAAMQRAVDRTHQTAEEVNRGSFGPYIKMDSVSHPTHTIGEGRTMKD